MRSVAFVRNVNQGQRGHPSTADLLAALADAGCLNGVAFQSNGTIVFESADPPTLIADAELALAARSGHEREWFWMPLDEVAEIAEAHTVEPDAARREFTVHRGATVDPTSPEVIREAAYRRCVVAHSGPGWVVCVNERDREGNATPVVERITGTSATSRGLSTLVRLVDRFGDHA